MEIYTYCTTIPEEAVIAQAVDKTVERSDRFSVKEALLLGVPVPDKVKPGEEVPEGLFLKADVTPEPAVAVGAQGSTEGPVKFATKLVNEYRGFSNFAPSPIVMAGKRYKTVEHYYQAMKFSGDDAWQEAIRVAEDPKKAKQLGKSKEHQIRADWDAAREGVMLEGLRAKFQQNRGLLDLLKSTGARPIIHASISTYWGEGRTGKGKNRMGKLLEQVREELREYVVPAAVGDQPPPAAADFFDTGDEGEDDEEEVVEGGGGGGGGAGPPGYVEPRPDELVRAGIQGGGGPGNEDDGEEDTRECIITSDQKVLIISLRKERVINSLQTLMKTVAVDCSLNFPDNDDGTYKCLGLGDSIGSFAYHPDLQKDIQETEAAFMTKDAALPAAALPAVPLPAAPLPQVPLPAAPLPQAPLPQAPAAPLQEAPPEKPRLKVFSYRKKDYRAIQKKDDANTIIGYVVYNAADIYGESAPIGFVKANPKGIPSGDILPVP